MRTVSIACATFNGGSFLEDQLRSIAQQSVKPDELVVTDDGSTDETLDILEHFAKSSEFNVRIYRNTERLGYRANFFKCAALCKSDLIAFCDQDDVWLPEKINVQKHHFNDPFVQMSVHGLSMIDAEGRSLGGLPGEPFRIFDGVEGQHPWYFRFGLTQMFRRDLLKHQAIYFAGKDVYESDRPMGHDAWMYFLAAVTGKVICSRAVLVLYRQHYKNTSGTKRRLNLKASLDRQIKARSQLYKNLALAGHNRIRLIEMIDANMPEEGVRERQSLAFARRRYKATLVSVECRLQIYELREDKNRSVFSLIRAMIHAVAIGTYGIFKPYKANVRSALKDLILITALRSK